MAHELPKRLVQSLRRPFYLLDAESERPVADTLFRPDGGPIAAAASRQQAIAEYEAWRLTQPCKNKSVYVRHDGGCLRCDADQGEACRRPQ